MFLVGFSWKVWEHWGLVLALSTRIFARPASLSKIPCNCLWFCPSRPRVKWPLTWSIDRTRWFSSFHFQSLMFHSIFNPLRSRWFRWLSQLKACTLNTSKPFLDSIAQRLWCYLSYLSLPKLPLCSSLSYIGPSFPDSLQPNSTIKQTTMSL